jgi:hypothetical protein
MLKMIDPPKGVRVETINLYSLDYVFVERLWLDM